jgi:lipoprotein-anchoring transpeptidase ErfK/SrfK
LLGPVVAGFALMLIAACSSSASASWNTSSGSQSPTGGRDAAKSLASLTITPATGAAEVSALAPVTVTVTKGKIDTVNMVNSAGKSIAGTLDADHTNWKTTAQLGYGKTYTVSATATGDDGKPVALSSSFTTVHPNNLTMPYLRSAPGHLLNESSTYGVGQPIELWFDESITNRAAAEKNLLVVTDPPVEGKWHWFDSHEVHWRPKEYWPSGTKVTVKTSIYGRDLGNGLYGESDVAASFTIGQSKIAIADHNTHHMQVFIDGAMVRDIPISMGKDGSTAGEGGRTVDFSTRSGPHVVMDKEPVTHMQSASFGIKDKTDPNYYDVDIKWTVHISGAGEYVHLRDWEPWALGQVNTSHGCINVGPEHIGWFYQTFGPGDIVDVKGSPIQLDPRDGVGDWTIPWAQW